MFNLTNRLNYEIPAAVLPAGTIGQPFTDAVAGTFGYMLGPLNRTVGLGTAGRRRSRSDICSDYSSKISEQHVTAPSAFCSSSTSTGRTRRPRCSSFSRVRGNDAG